MISLRTRNDPNRSRLARRLYKNRHHLMPYSSWYSPFGFDDELMSLRKFPARLGLPVMFSDPWTDRWPSDDSDSYNDDLDQMIDTFFDNRYEGRLFRDNKLSKYTNKLFDEIEHNKGEDLPEENPKELLDCPKSFKQLIKQTKRKDDVNNTVVRGESFESSTISKNGKTVTVSKHSKLNPDGTIKTKVEHHYEDEKGNEKSKSWKKLLNTNRKVKSLKNENKESENKDNVNKENKIKENDKMDQKQNDKMDQEQNDKMDQEQNNQAPEVEIVEEGNKN
jgi:hypothetical protein